ncbi:hypothetical protein ACHAWU_000710 [Discostella pseudostelligera]|uniref:Uncharacterized protein n=1 Tax=Discostella pseudostelligera TaxID=259834 RepID=A0ABD3MBT0_9STRA
MAWLAMGISQADLKSQAIRITLIVRISSSDMLELNSSAEINICSMAFITNASNPHPHITLK